MGKSNVLSYSLVEALLMLDVKAKLFGELEGFVVFEEYIGSVWLLFVVLVPLAEVEIFAVVAVSDGPAPVIELACSAP